MKKAIIIMGKAGSGKSTIGRAVAEVLGWTYCSSGDIARSLIDGEWQALGLMAPESEMRRAFKEAVSEDGFYIIDGMPRKPDQVDFIDTLFDEVNYYIISLTDEEAMDRLLKRNRTDDTESAIAQRLRDYKYTTEKAIAKVRKRHPIVTIDGRLSTTETIEFIAHRFI